MRAVVSSSPSSSAAASTSPCDWNLKKKKKKRNGLLVVSMAKRKGLPSSPPQGGPEPAPPRITSNVKQNLQFLKMWKAISSTVDPAYSSSPPPPPPPPPPSFIIRDFYVLQEYQKRNSGYPKPATSYRRKRQEKEELPEDIELYRDPTLSLY